MTTSTDAKLAQLTMEEYEALHAAAIALYRTCVLDDDPPIWECDAAWAKFAAALGRSFADDMKVEETE